MCSPFPSLASLALENKVALEPGARLTPTHVIMGQVFRLSVSREAQIQFTPLSSGRPLGIPIDLFVDQQSVIRNRQTLHLLG